MRHLLIGIALVSLTCVAITGHAQQGEGGYPNKPVRMMVPSAPGGGLDTFTRLIAQNLSDLLNRRFIVENRPDGSGTVAIDILAKAAPDGYTLYVGGSDLELAGALKKVSYDVRTAYTPIVQIAASPYFLIASPSLPVNSVRDLITYAKSNPGKLNFASSGVGSSIHLGFEMLNSKAGIKLVHVPYKGNTTAYTDLYAGQIHLMLTNPTSSMPLVKAGKVKLLATTGAARARAFPDLPSVSETIAGYEHGNTSGVYGPAGVPAGIVQMLNRSVSQVANSAEVKAKIEADGSEVMPPNSPAEFREKFLRKVAQWEDFVNKSGIKFEELQ